MSNAIKASIVHKAFEESPERIGALFFEPSLPEILKDSDVLEIVYEATQNLTPDGWVVDLKNHKNPSIRHALITPKHRAGARSLSVGDEIELSYGLNTDGVSVPSKLFRVAGCGFEEVRNSDVQQ